MQQLRMFTNRIDEAQDKIKTINSAIKQRINDDPKCQSIKEDLTEARNRLKQAINLICAEYEKELEDLNTLKTEVKMDKENSVDEALSLFKNDELEPIKKGKFTYKPVFSLKWKKVKPEND